MDEYELMNYMSIVTSKSKGQFDYLPHHPVIRDTSQTTKLRVVYNASSKTSTGISLNDCIPSGPALQSDLATVLSQWRSYLCVFVADIAKMYRQILVAESDWDYQRIVWRSSPNENLCEYRLNTVTYGTRSAPILALRVVKQLTIDEGDRYPIAREILNYDTYVDDILFGAFDRESTI